MITSLALKDLINLDIHGILRLLKNIFTEWILSLKPKDVKDKGISKQTLWNNKKRIRKNEMEYRSKALKEIYKVYQDGKLND